MMRHRYSYETDTEGGSAAARLIRLVGHQKDVLELGTGPGSVTRLLQANGCKVTGVEVDTESVEMCRPYCFNIIQSDLESDGWIAALEGKTFDVIVVADVLEHLKEPATLLKRLGCFLRTEGYLVLSLPNVSHLTVVASLLAGRFPYQRNGLLDQTHLRFFGREDIDALLRETGFLWHRWEAARLEPIHGELSGYWNRLDDEDRSFLAQRVVDGDVYQHVIAAFPSSDAGHVAKAQIDLASMQSALMTARKELEDIKRERLLSERQFEFDLQKLHASVAEANGTIQSVQQHSNALEAERNLLQLEHSNLAAQLRAAQHECQMLRDETSKIEVLTHSLRQMAAVDEQRLLEIAKLKLEEGLIRASRSWRLTAPIRFVSQMLARK